MFKTVLFVTMTSGVIWGLVMPGIWEAFAMGAINGIAVGHWFANNFDVYGNFRRVRK